MWPFTTKQTVEQSPYRTPGREIDTSIAPYSEFACRPQQADVQVYKPPPIVDTSTPEEKALQKKNTAWALVFHGGKLPHGSWDGNTQADAYWKVAVKHDDEKRYLFLTNKDMTHLATILEPENRKAWTKDGIFGFERPGMKFYVQSYMAPLVLQSLLTCKRDNNIP